MKTLTVRKNFNFKKELIDKTSKIVNQKNKNFTQIITSYFQAIAKNPDIIDFVEQQAKKRTGNFIGMLDGKIGNDDYHKLRGKYHEDIS